VQDRQANTGAARKVVVACDVAADGNADTAPGMPDGLKGDRQGNVCREVSG
jgi:hypothetical protein